MAIPVDLFEDNTYTVMQVCELLRRSVIMTENMVPDHQIVKELIGFSLVSKFRDALGWMLETDDKLELNRLITLTLNRSNRDKDMSEVIELWRSPKSQGHTKESYRDRMTTDAYRAGANGKRGGHVG